MQLYDEIKSHFILPNAFTDWENYRNTLTDYLLTQTDQISLPLTFHPDMQRDEMLPTLAVLGAGACNDLDLLRLSSHFSKITLIDTDEDSMQTALHTWHLEHSDKIECTVFSLNGLTDSDYKSFCKNLQSFLQEEKMSITLETFENYALSLVNKFYKKSRQAVIPLTPASFDYIWCFGLHSQLQAMFAYIYHVFEVNLKHSLYHDNSLSSERFYNRLKEENNYFIPHFHDTLLASAKKGIFLGLEQKRLERNENVEGAYQAIQDIRSRNLHLNEGVILWPFNPADDISFEMLIQRITL